MRIEPAPLNLISMTAPLHQTSRSDQTLINLVIIKQNTSFSLYSSILANYPCYCQVNTTYDWEWQNRACRWTEVDDSEQWLKLRTMTRGCLTMPSVSKPSLHAEWLIPGNYDPFSEIRRLASNIYDESVPNIVPGKSVHGIVDPVRGGDFDVAGDVVLPAQIHHLLCLPYSPCHAPFHRPLACRSTGYGNVSTRSTLYRSGLSYDRSIRNSPKMRGKEGSSSGRSGAPTVTNVPFTLSNSRIGPSECFAETVSNTKSRLLFPACINYQEERRSISINRCMDRLGAPAHISHVRETDIHTVSIGADDEIIGAEPLLCLGLLGRGSADDGDMVAERLPKLDCHVAKASETDYPDLPRWRVDEVAVLERAEDRYSAAQQRRRRVHWQVVGYAYNVPSKWPSKL